MTQVGIKHSAIIAPVKRHQEKLMSPSEKREMIAVANRRGELHKLFWFIQVRVPMSMRMGWDDDGITSAAFPLNWVPVVPVGENHDITLSCAEILCELFRVDNPKTIEFNPAITTLDALNERVTGRWYVWGTLDMVCPGCGGVGYDSCVCKPTLFEIKEAA